MKYIVLNGNVVFEIIPEFDENLPDVPISERYPADFIARCIVVDDDVPCEQNWIYDKDSNSFYEPSAPAPNFTLEQAIAFKCDEINSDSQNAIIKGFEFDDLHYSLTLADQSNISDLVFAVKNGMKFVPYHADGEECRLYSDSEFLRFYEAYNQHKLYHTTYCNLLKVQVKSYSETNKIYDVKYGITKLEGEFAERFNQILGLISEVF